MYLTILKGILLLLVLLKEILANKSLHNYTKIYKYCNTICHSLSLKDVLFEVFR